MRIITVKRIWEAKARWPQSANALDTWYRLLKGSKPVDSPPCAPFVRRRTKWARCMCSISVVTTCG